MSFINFFRVIRKGLINFKRNGWLSAATVSIMVITLFVMGSLYIVSDLANNVTEELQDKIDISAYFKDDAPEDKILDARKFVLQNSSVKSVEYISKEEAWENFKNKHRDNQVISESIQEVGSNPLYATLNIKAQHPDSYSQIAGEIEKSSYMQYIQKLNYEQNKNTIDRFSGIISAVRKTGLFTAVFLAVIVVLVTFNTIRLTIYTHRQEIEIMKLVGGTNWFIRGPFVVEGLLYGIMAAVIAIFLMYAGISIVSAKITGFLPSSDLISFYLSNVWILFFMLLAAGSILGSLSSFIAIRKYLDQ